MAHIARRLLSGREKDLELIFLSAVMHPLPRSPSLVFQGGFPRKLRKEFKFGIPAFAHGGKMRTICHIAKFTSGRAPTSLIPYFDKIEFEFLRARRVEYFQPRTGWQFALPVHTHGKKREKKREFLFHLLNLRLLVIRA